MLPTCDVGVCTTVWPDGAEGNLVPNAGNSRKGKVSTKTEVDNCFCIVLSAI